MESTRAMLDALRARAGSDGKAAALFGVSQVTVSRWRAGRDFPTDEHALKLAELLEVDPAYVLALIRAERAKSSQARAQWQRVAERFKDAAVLAALAVGAASFGLPTPSSAGTLHLPHSALNARAQYTLHAFQFRRPDGGSGNRATGTPSSTSASCSSCVAWPRMARPGDSR